MAGNSIGLGQLVRRPRRDRLDLRVSHRDENAGHVVAQRIIRRIRRNFGEQFRKRSHQVAEAFFNPALLMRQFLHFHLFDARERTGAIGKLHSICARVACSRASLTNVLREPGGAQPMRSAGPADRPLPLRSWLTLQRITDSRSWFESLACL